MAIQGIIRGFAQPANMSQNVILVGRGVHYVLLVDGRQHGDAHLELDEACKAFDTEASGRCNSEWAEVLELVSSSVGDCSTVTRTGRTTYQPLEA